MLLYDTFTCQNCKKDYKGLFKIDSKLNIVCIDCKNKEKYPRIKVNFKANELEKDMVIDYLEKDITHLYPIIQTLEETNLDLFLNENGELDTYKLYFQGNDLEFCTESRNIAYKCLDYLDTNDQKHINFAEDVINKYLNLRFVKLDSNEKNNYIDIFNSKEMEYILFKIEV